MDDRKGKPDYKAQEAPDRLEVIQSIIDHGVPLDASVEAVLDRSGNAEMAQDDPAGQATPDSKRCPTLDARALTAGGDMVLIRLDGQTYTLRITRQNKLILTK